MKTLALTSLIACLAFASTAALAAMDEATKAALATCQDTKATPEKGVAACTAVLNSTSVKLGPKSKAQLYYNRAGFQIQARNNAKAAEDFTAAINSYENDPDKANWPADFVGVIDSSYAFRAQINAQDNKCDAARADYRSAAATSREVSEREDYEKKAQNVCK